MLLWKTAKSNQEQALASWINYLNSVRFERLTVALRNQDQNWENATASLGKVMVEINENIIQRNRGGLKGMHGFIAEAAECGIGNARAQIVGKGEIYEWINDNGPTDLIRNGMEIQQKFVAAGNHLSLQAVARHLEKYPDYIRCGKRYQIPADHYEKIKYLLSIGPEEAYKMPTEDGEFSLKQWREVHEFFQKGDVQLKDIEPSMLRYDEVQRGRIEETLQQEKAELAGTDRQIRNEAYETSKPSVKQASQAALVAAAVEGGTAFVTAVVKKRRSGKQLHEFSNEDWVEIIEATGTGTIKGGIRGVSIYALTNLTSTPAAVASALCTSAFGVAEQVHRYRSGLISREELITNSEILCLDTAVSALSSLIGSTIIPIPVLGAVIGNTVGSMMYQFAKDSFPKQERKLIEQQLQYLSKLNAELDQKYRKFVEDLNAEMQLYYQLLERAFSPNYDEALQGSVALAKHYGIPGEELLKSVEEIDDYFLN